MMASGCPGGQLAACLPRDFDELTLHPLRETNRGSIDRSKLITRHEKSLGRPDPGAVALRQGRQVNLALVGLELLSVPDICRDVAEDAFFCLPGAADEVVSVSLDDAHEVPFVRQSV
jgi:hypothetical protein